ncbi:class I SAM-dependent methyltransferase [Desulfosarcina sp. OttesenSCG-928-A07]|nr:class I SAM-dependent methyltransferase [Desulfosarcina sp. OttesenSCG-928-A07]
MDNGYDLHPTGLTAPCPSPPQNGLSADLKTRLMLAMLAPAAGESILDIGCGTGASCGLLVERGLDVTGIYETSERPADMAGNRISLQAEKIDDLPFGDNDFNYACLMDCLSFAENPQDVLKEAFRVAKDKVFIGFLNRYAVSGIRRCVRGMFVVGVDSRPTVFSIWEIKRMIRELLGPVPVHWRTVGHNPALQMNAIPEAGPKTRWRTQWRTGFFQHFPFGPFVGMVVTLVPRFRTRPLVLGQEARTLRQTADYAGMAP